MNASPFGRETRATSGFRARAAALLLLSAALASPLAASAFGSAEEKPRFVCLGVREEPAEKARADSSGSRAVFHEFLPLLLDASVGFTDSIYVVRLYRTIAPYLERVLGSPIGIDTLEVRIDTTLVTGAYASGRAVVMPRLGRGLFQDSDGDGSIDEDGYDGIDNDGDGRIDEDPDTSPSWDNMFIHESTHAMQRGLLRAGIVDSWWIEAFAVANEWFVAREAAIDGCSRPLPGGDGGAATAGLDGIEEAGAQVLGGRGRLIDRVESWTCYRNAGGVLLLSGIAQMLASGPSPHPIERLMREMENEIRTPGVRDPWAAVDRAWDAPIDGVFPPSRWIRARPIACPAVRDGSFLALFASGLHGGYDPPSVRILRFDRSGDSRFEMRSCSRPVVLTNTRGESFRVVPKGDLAWIRELSLPPGAYRVEAEETGADGRELRARSWILVPPSSSSSRIAPRGTPVIFIDPNGLPFDPPDLRTNGRIVERVPGGAVIELSGGGTLSLRSGERFLGAVTVPDPLPRTALVRIGCDKGEGVVAWNPYRGAPGEPIEVSIRRSESALDPGDTELALRLFSGRGRRPEYLPLVPREADPDLLTARFVLPEDAPYVSFSFRGLMSRHGSVWDEAGVLHGYGMRLDEPNGAVLLSARIEGDRLVLVFEKWTNPSRLRLLFGRGGGEWIERPDPPQPIDQGSTVLSWTLHGSSDCDDRFRVWERAYGEERLLVSLQGGGRRAEGGEVTTSSPGPNPSRAGVRWSIRTPRSIAVRFAVYDLRGRRIDGPTEIRLSAGTNEIAWEGRSGERDLPSGIYFLHIEGPGFVESRRVVLLRDR